MHTLFNFLPSSFYCCQLPSRSPIFCGWVFLFRVLFLVVYDRKIVPGIYVGVCRLCFGGNRLKKIVCTRLFLMQLDGVSPCVLPPNWYMVHGSWCDAIPGISHVFVYYMTVLQVPYHVSLPRKAWRQKFTSCLNQLHENGN